MDLLCVGTTNKTESPRFLHIVRVLLLNTTATWGSHIRIIVCWGAFPCSIPPISGNTGGWVRHGQDLLVQENVRRVHVETSKGIPIYKSETTVVGDPQINPHSNLKFTPK